jgi:hypothetical protein
MYNPMTAAPTPVSAWVNAARRLKVEGDLHGLMLHIENPIGFGPGEEDVVCRVDAFLRDHDKCGISTVSNTIFPADLDRGDGIEALTDRYMETFARRMHRQGEWGRYFQRMVAWPIGSERNAGSVNQLAEHIRSLRAMREGRARFFGNVTEIALFDPVRDLRKKMNRQCLSFIELKPDRDGDTWRLSMMAVYRNHYYVQRTLGNLIGLGRLLQFIAREAGFEVGTLTIQSTHACLDSDLSKADVAGLIATIDASAAIEALSVVLDNPSMIETEEQA